MIDIFIRNHSFSVFCDRQKLFDANILKFRRFLLTLQQVKSDGPVAQLNRASDSGSECRGFESHRGHMNVKSPQACRLAGICVFMYSTLERSLPLRGRIAKMRLRRTYSSLHQLINVGLRNILQYQDSQFGLDIITILSTAESISSI